MNTMLIPTQTAMIPSSFGMPACGHISLEAAYRVWTPATTGVRVRPLTQGDVASHIGSAVNGNDFAATGSAVKATGIPAWRPPIG